MSFTRDVKLEILENKPMHRHFKNALAYGLFSHGQHFSVKEMSLRTRFAEVAEEYSRLAKDILGKDAKIKITTSSNTDPVYRVWIVDKKQREKLIEYFEKISSHVFENEKELYTFFAGAFLACGNITNPQKGYHLEFVVPSKELGQDLLSLLEERLPKLKTTTRRSQFVVYCKECSQIQDALTMMSASKGALRVIEVEMFKNVRNHANRVTNCETSNISKVVGASTSQIDDINYILDTKGELYLTPSQLETAKVRMENPYASLRELAELFPTPISRSGLHHRLAALTKIAKGIREENVNV